MSNVEAPNVNADGEITNQELLSEQSGMPNMSSTKTFTVDTNMQVNGDLDVTGTVTATSFIGDGSQLTGISGGTGGGLDSAAVTLLVDSDYVQAREVPQDFAYSSLTGAPTALSSFTNDTSYITALDIPSTVDSDYVAARTPAGDELEVQSRETTSEYYIYVGDPANKLSQIQDTRGAVSNLVYDQEFATLQEAFNFMMENPLADVGYNDYSGGDKNAAYVIALEQGVTHAATGGYLRLAHVNAQILLLSQNAVDPAGANGSAATIGAGGDYFVLYGMPQLQMGGDIVVAAFAQIGHSNIKWFFNQYNDDVSWNGGLKIYDGSTFYTDGDINSGITVQDGSYANVRTVNATSLTRVSTASTLLTGTVTCTATWEVQGGSFADAGSLTTTGGTLQVRGGSTLRVRNALEINGTARLDVKESSKLITNTISGTSTATNHLLGHSFDNYTTAEVVSLLNGGTFIGKDGSAFHDISLASGVEIPFEFNGDITANAFIGDGSQLTNLPAGGGLDSAATIALIGMQNKPAGDNAIQITPDTSTLNGDNNNIIIGTQISDMAGIGPQSVAMGYDIGAQANGVSIGYQAGAGSQSTNSGGVFIGSRTNYFGNSNPADYAIAIGHEAGAVYPGVGSIALGKDAGKGSSGDYTVAIGYNANNTSNFNNTIMIKADGTSAYNSTAQYDIDIRTSAAGSLSYNTTNDWTFGAGVTMTDLTASGATVVFSNLPTTDPVNAGQLWNDAGTLKISAG